MPGWTNWDSCNCSRLFALVHACDEAPAGKPYSGNLYLRFDEGSGAKPPLLLYCKVPLLMAAFNLHSRCSVG
jgi:hypothetical protein